MKISPRRPTQHTTPKPEIKREDKPTQTHHETAHNPPSQTTATTGSPPPTTANQPAQAFPGAASLSTFANQLHQQIPTTPPAPEPVAVPTPPLNRGTQSPQVQEVQQGLVDLGYMTQDQMDTGPGIFGPQTQASVEDFQRDQGIPLTGVYDQATADAMSTQLTQQANPTTPATDTPNAPTTDAPADVQGTTATAPTRPTGPADSQVAELGQQAVGFAEAEIADGVSEASNMTRINEYATEARGIKGTDWCGYFTAFNQGQAAEAAGGALSDDAKIGLQSMQKAVHMFTYSNYTDNSAAENQRLGDLRTEHEGQGSTRRFMMLDDATTSGMGRDAEAHGAEVFGEPQQLMEELQPGDVILLEEPGHVATVKSADPETGELVLVEGNMSDATGEFTYNFYEDTNFQDRVVGFGRLALDDYGLAN